MSQESEELYGVFTKDEPSSHFEDVAVTYPSHKFIDMPSKSKPFPSVIEDMFIWSYQWKDLFLPKYKLSEQVISQIDSKIKICSDS